MHKRSLKMLPEFLLYAVIVFTVVACGGNSGSNSENNDDQPADLESLADDVDLPDPNQKHSISGKILASRSSLVDSDVNDEESTPVPNNKISEAQKLFTPITLGGFVGRPGAGPEGAVNTNGDVSDFYEISLPGYGYVELRTADHEEADLDLYAYTTQCTDESCFSNDCGQEAEAEGAVTQSIQVSKIDRLLNISSQPVALFIEVCAVTGSSNYTLSVGGSSQTSAVSTDDNFVPGEIIVEFERTSRKRVLNKNKRGEFSYRGLRKVAGEVTRPSLFQISSEDQDIVTKKSFFSDKRILEKRKHVAEYYPELLAKWDTVQTLNMLRQDPNIVSANLNYILETQAIPNDEAYELQWHYPMINLPDAWDITTGDSSVLVAVIDGGFIDHPDYRGKMTPGFDFIRDTERSYDGDGIDPDPYDRERGDLRYGDRSNFHGTHVAGTIAANTNDGDDRGVAAGVSWGASIMPLRTCGKGGCDSYGIIQAVLYASGQENDSGMIPDRTADIINLSLGGPNYIEQFEQVYLSARDRGIFIVAAAGNDNNSELQYPASYSGVTSVAAVDINKDRASYSSFGSTIDIAAPGGDYSTSDANGDGFRDGVLSTWGNDSDGSIETTYSFRQGTSMASPHTAGVIALMKSVNPDLTPDQFDQLLASGQITDELGERGWDQEFGYGLINAYKAVIAAESRSVDSPILNVHPKSLNLGEDGMGLLQVANGGGGEITGLVITAKSDNSRLKITALNTDENSLGEYSISADLSNLDDSTQREEILISSSAGDATIPVYFRAPRNQTPDVGIQYLILVNLSSDEPAGFLTATVNSEGEYPFEFNDIPGGHYFLFVGSDLDNDYFICDEGESCGSFPGLNSQDGFILDDSIQGITIQSSFQVDIFSGESSAESSTDPSDSAILKGIARMEHPQL